MPLTNGGGAPCWQCGALPRTAERPVQVQWWPWREVLRMLEAALLVVVAAGGLAALIAWVLLMHAGS